jgi:hypothetical protein
MPSSALPGPQSAGHLGTSGGTWSPEGKTHFPEVGQGLSYFGVLVFQVDTMFIHLPLIIKSLFPLEHLISLNWTALISLKITIRKNKQIQLSKQNM